MILFTTLKTPATQLAQSIKLDSNLGSTAGTGKQTGELLTSPCRASVTAGKYPPSDPTDSQASVKR